MTTDSLKERTPLESGLRLVQARQQRLVIIGLFVLTVLLAIRAASHHTPAELLKDPLILLIPAGLGAFVLLRWPYIGIVGMMAAGLVIPFEIGTGTGTRLNASILLMLVLLGLWVFNVIVQKERFRVAKSRAIWPLVLFVGAAFLSFLAGQLPWFLFAQKASISAQVGGLALFVLAAGAFIIVASVVRDLRVLEGMVWLYLALAAIHVVGQIVPGMKSVTQQIMNPGTYTNSIFWIWIVALAFSQAMYNRHLHKFWRTALMGLVLGAFAINLIRDSGWTSGWLPSGVALGTILAINGSRLTWLVVVAGLGGLSTKLDSLRSLLFAGDNTYSLMTRVEAWRIIAEIVKVNPLLGLGPANYYWYTPLYSILGYYVQFNSHNNYVDLVAQVGLVGLALFLWFSGELAVVGWWLRNRVPEGFARAYVYGALGGLAATLVAGMFGDWFLPFIYNIGFRGFQASILGWMFLGGLVALQQMLRLGLLAPPDQKSEEA